MQVLYGKIVGEDFETTESYKFDGDWEKAYRGAVERNCDIKFYGRGYNLPFSNERIHDIMRDVDRFIRNDS
jgi:hypothetical protein